VLQFLYSLILNAVDIAFYEVSRYLQYTLFLVQNYPFLLELFTAVFFHSNNSKDVLVGAELVCLGMPFCIFSGKTALVPTGGNCGMLYDLTCAYWNTARMHLANT
jgi:hypothetical protein